jgi:8-oxo-dGTP pyrophosphatase MutT (NUDIX family)
MNRKDYDSWVVGKEGYIRAADMFILNDNGQLWVPVRTADKKIAPNGYDFATGGHVESGDDYLETIIREVKEEINVDLQAGMLEFIAKLKDEAGRYITCVYLYRTNQTPVFNPSDFVSAEWLAPDAVIAAIDSGHPAKSSLPGKIRVLQTYLSGS